MKLIIKRPWAGADRVMQPGEYSVPGDLSRLHARCCVLDGAGELVDGAAATDGEVTFRGKRKPASAPENKAGGAKVD